MNEIDQEKNPEYLIKELKILPPSDLEEASKIIRSLYELLKEKEQETERSYYDPRTGLFNEKGLERELERLESGRKEIVDVDEKRESTKQESIAVVVLDLTGLGIANDEISMSAGDRYLEDAGKAMKVAAQRRNDLIVSLVGESTEEGIVAIPSRLGGQADEFALILPGATENTSKIIINKIRSELEKLNIEAQEDFSGISYGISTSTTTCSDPTEVPESIRRARDKLGEAKKRDKAMTGEKRGGDVGDLTA